VSASDEARLQGGASSDIPCDAASSSSGHGQDYRQQQHQPTSQRTEVQQPPQGKSFDFSNPHAVADLVSLYKRARVALECANGITFDIESLGGILTQAIPSSHSLYSMVMPLPSTALNQLTIASMIFSTKMVSFMQAAYLSAAAHLNAIYSPAVFSAAMCERTCESSSST
jgi:hypothetical protein